MSKKHCSGGCGDCNCDHSTPDPTSGNYASEVKNKANENTPYAKAEPSKHTKHQ